MPRRHSARRCTLLDCISVYPAAHSTPFATLLAAVLVFRSQLALAAGPAIGGCPQQGLSSGRHTGRTHKRSSTKSAPEAFLCQRFWGPSWKLPSGGPLGACKPSTHGLRDSCHFVCATVHTLLGAHI